MKAEKVTVRIEVEVLSIDVLRSLLADVLTHIEAEAESGSLAMADGDCVTWQTTRAPVSF